MQKDVHEAHCVHILLRYQSWTLSLHGKSQTNLRQAAEATFSSMVPVVRKRYT